ncbi:MAG: DUF3592 domain-containing protein [Anaerolineales bacterium]|nr:MAG: DUF3592 domain-containing protein [Anaerolineales bacterium]
MSNIPRIMRIVGWIVFACMWIPFILMFFNMPGEGSYEFNELPRNMIIFLGLTLGMMFIAMGLLFGSSMASWLLKKMAESRGERMTARIIKMKHTGLVVNRSMDEVQFTLELNYMGETVEASTEKLLSRYSPLTYQEGMMVNVMYDPGTKTIALVD